MLKSFTPQKGIAIEEENIFPYISRYICRKVSRSACDQSNVDANNKLHTILSKKQYLNIQGVGLLFHVKT